MPEVGENHAPAVDWKQIILPFPLRHPEVERTRDITYRRVAGLSLKLDVYRHRSHPTHCPTLLQIHGGAWVVGSKNEQGLPLVLHLLHNWLADRPLLDGFDGLHDARG